MPPLTDEQMNECIWDLKEYYRTHLCDPSAYSLNDDIPFRFVDVCPNLTLLALEGMDANQGKVIRYSDILKTEVNGIVPTRLLIQGEGGAGKTTLCAKIAWDWTNGKGFRDFKLILFVPVRNLNENKTVGGIMKSYLPQTNRVHSTQLDEYILTNQDSILLIFDGLDTNVGDVPRDSMLGNILHSVPFAPASVLVTMRPRGPAKSSCHQNLGETFTVFAIKGFSEEGACRYVKHFFGNDIASATALIQCVSNNYVISQNMASFPMYVDWLCKIWHAYDEERRCAVEKLRTFSQMVMEIVLFLMDHYVSTQGSTRDSTCPTNQGQMDNELMVHLGLIAFNELLARRVGFSEEEFSAQQEAVNIGIQTGVLIPDRHITLNRERQHGRERTECVLKFSHELLQEYLAGLYLASLYNSNFDEYKRTVENVLLPTEEAYYRLMYFTSSSGKEVGVDIISRMIKRGNTVERADLFVGTAFECHDLEAVAVLKKDDILTPWMLTINADMNAHLIYAYLFLTNHDVETLFIFTECNFGRTMSRDVAEAIAKLPSLRTMQLTGPKGSLHSDFYSILAESASTSKINTLDICRVNISDDASASRDLARFLCLTPWLRELSLNHMKSHPDFFSTAASLAPSSKIQTIYISDVDLQGDISTSSNLARFLWQQPCLRHTTLLVLTLHTVFFSTAALLAASSKMRYLELQMIDLLHDPVGSRDLATCLCSMPCLIDLKLYYTTLHCEFMSTVASLASSAKFQKLELNPVEDLINDTSTSRDMARFVCLLPCLTDLKFDVMKTRTGPDDLFSTALSLAAPSKIHQLEISHMELFADDTRSADLAKFLCAMPALKEMKLSDCRLHDRFYAAAAAVDPSSKLESLNLANIDLSVDASASRDLATFLCGMPRLLNLTLDDVKLHREFFATAAALALSSQIQVIVLRNMILPEDSSAASRDLARFLCTMPHLDELNLGQNNELHDDFFPAAASLASSCKIGKLTITSSLRLSDRAASSVALAKCLCLMPCLKNLTFNVKPHVTFFSVMASGATSAKIHTLKMAHTRLSQHGSASTDLAQTICSMPCLSTLSLKHISLHRDFFATAARFAPSSQIQTLDIEFKNELTEDHEASGNLARSLCLMPHLRDVSLSGQLHGNFFSTAASLASSAKIQSMCMCRIHLSHDARASSEWATFLCSMPSLMDLWLHDMSAHSDFFTTALCFASNTRISTMEVSFITGLANDAALSSDLARFLFSMSSLTGLSAQFRPHRDFFTTAASIAAASKIHSLEVAHMDLIDDAEASRDFATCLCAMPCLSALKLSHVRLHRVFFSTAASLAPSAKIRQLVITLKGSLSGCASSSRDLARFLFLMPRLTHMAMEGIRLHGDFFSTAAILATSSKISTMELTGMDLIDDTCDLMSSLPSLTDLKLVKNRMAPEFFFKAASLAPFSKIRKITLNGVDLSGDAMGSHAFSKFLYSMPCLTKLTVQDVSLKATEISSTRQSPLTDLSVDDVTLSNWTDIGLMSLFPGITKIGISFYAIVAPDILRVVQQPQLRELHIRSNYDGYSKPRPRLNDRPLNLCQTLNDSFPHLIDVTFTNCVFGNAGAEEILRFVVGKSHIQSIRMNQCGTSERLDPIIDELGGNNGLNIIVTHGGPTIYETRLDY